MPASVRMVPSAYDAYLAAVATAAAALIGLLFVAVSVRDDSIFGVKAIPGGEALAITAFTGLVNSFVVAVLGLIPKVNIGEPAVIMAVIGMAATIRLQHRLHTGRNLIVLAITLLAYAAQCVFGVLLLVKPHDSHQLINLYFIVFVTLIVSLQRAWSLLKGKHLATVGGTPGNLWRRIDDLVWQLGSNIAQAADHCLAREAQRTLRIPAVLPQIHELGCRVDCLSQVC